MSGPAESPRFSVVIPTYERPRRLVRCLESFRGLQYPAGAWELIVVNDGGERSFSAVPEELKQALPLRLVDAEHRGPAAARNRGAELATGEYIALTDDDCEVEPGWLSAYAAGFASGPWDCLGGKVVNLHQHSMAARAWQYYLDFLTEFMWDGSNTALLPSNNVACRREVYRALGGFDETFPLAAGEDFEFSLRLVDRGYRQGNFPDARILHNHPASLLRFLMQEFRHGKGEYYFRRSIAQSGIQRFDCGRQFMPSLRSFLRRHGADRMTSVIVLLIPKIYHAGYHYERLWGASGETGGAAQST